MADYSWCPQTRTRVLTNHALSIVFVLLLNTDLFEGKKERKKERRKGIERERKEIVLTELVQVPRSWGRGEGWKTNPVG